MTITKADLIKILKSFIYGSQGAQLQQKAGTYELLTEDTGAHIREVLREELRKELNYITFSAESFMNSWRGTISASRIGKRVCAQADDVVHVGEDFIVADAQIGRVYRLTRDYEILWEWFSPIPTEHWGLDYDPQLDRILVNTQTSVFELDVASGAQLHSLSSVGGNTFQTAAFSGAAYDEEDPTTFYITSFYNHILWRTNWAGDALWTFGTYGVATANMNQPLNVHPRSLATTGHLRKVMVGSRALNQFYQIDVTGSSVDWRVPCYLESRPVFLPNDYMALPLGHDYFGLTYLFEPASTTLLPAYLLPPTATVHGSEDYPWRLLLMTRWGFTEIDLRLWRNMPLPREVPLWTNSAVGVAGSSIPGLMDFFYKDVSVVIHSTASGTLYIDRAPILRLTDGYWDGSTWHNLITESVSANTLLKVPLTRPVGVARVRFVPSAEATVQGWYEME